MSGGPNPSTVPPRTALRPTAALPHSQMPAVMRLRAQAFYPHSTDRNIRVTPAEFTDSPLLPELLQRRCLPASLDIPDRDAQSRQP